MEAAALVEMSVGIGYVKCEGSASIILLAKSDRFVVPDTEARFRP